MTESEKAILRAEKAIEAIASEIEAIPFRCWTLELAQPRPDDDGPPAGWKPTEAN